MHNLLRNNLTSSIDRGFDFPDIIQPLLDFIEVEGGVGINESFYKYAILVTEATRMTSPSCKKVLDLPIFLVVMTDIGN